MRHNGSVIRHDRRRNNSKFKTKFDKKNDTLRLRITYVKVRVEKLLLKNSYELHSQEMYIYIFASGESYLKKEKRIILEPPT